MVKLDIQYPHNQINNGTYGDNEEHLCNIPAESGKGDFCQTSKQYPIFGKENRRGADHIPVVRVAVDERVAAPRLLLVIQKESPVRTTHSASLREQPSGWWI